MPAASVLGVSGRNTDRTQREEQTMYAIVKTGGKQYRVEEGDLITVEKLEGDTDTSIELTEVLMISGDNGMTIGVPTVEGAVVMAKIVKQIKAPKVNGFTFKPKKNIHHRYGHRQKLTTLSIESITA